jgi:hypothetical protein
LVACRPVGTDKRQRKKANRAARLQTEQKAARRRDLIRRVVLLVAVTIGVLALALLFNLLSDDDPEPTDEQGAAVALGVPAVAAPTA